MTEQITFSPADESDIALLRQLYFEVYGGSYPLKLGSDPVEMGRLIQDPHAMWVVARDSSKLMGAALCRLDEEIGVAKLEGVAVRPDCRTLGVARHMVGLLCEQTLSRVDSMYATCRTVSFGPQRMVLANGFKPYGIMPNSVTATAPETLALFVRHRDGVLERRSPPGSVLADLEPLVSMAEKMTGGAQSPRTVIPSLDSVPPATAVEFETIDGAEFVRRRFMEKIPDPAKRFYPFHSPNLLLASGDGGLEVYLHLNRSASYGTLVGAWPDVGQASEALESIIDVLESLGVRYAEALVPLRDTARLRSHLMRGFVPSALYPAMHLAEDGYLDYVVMSRTTSRLDFRRLEIDPSVEPYLDYYRSTWAKIYLGTIA